MNRSAFSFVYEGTTYEIISVVMDANGGRNYLVSRDEERFLLRAQDTDQDGRLDTLLVGDLTLERANDIYVRGIAEAQARGRYRQRRPARAYVMTRGTGRYIIQTHLLDPDTWYNRFILFEAGGSEGTVLLDTDADGVLDEVERGTCDLTVCQKVFDQVLREGIREGRIERIEDRYVVKSTSNDE